MNMRELREALLSDERRLSPRDLFLNAQDLASEDGDNEEYDRALAEVLCDTIGVSTDHKDTVQAMLHQRSPVRTYSLNVGVHHADLGTGVHAVYDIGPIPDAQTAVALAGLLIGQPAYRVRDLVEEHVADQMLLVEEGPDFSDETKDLDIAPITVERYDGMVRDGNWSIDVVLNS